MRYGVGVDFGTSNSTAAVYDGDSVLLIPLEGDDPIMPSATYIDRDLQTLTGQSAIDRYIQDNTGRTVEMIPEVIAETSQFVDRRATPIRKPKMVANTMPQRETKMVFSSPTKKARP